VHHGAEKAMKCMSNGNVYDWSDFCSVAAASNSANIKVIDMGSMDYLSPKPRNKI